MKHGFERTLSMTRTLQGEVFEGRMVWAGHEWSGRRVVIKKTSKRLHSAGVTVTASGRRVAVQENIVLEAELLRRFHAHSPPSSLVELVAFFEDSLSYYLVLEHGGSDYFDFVVRCHERIVAGQLALSEWRKHCKFMFAQMVQFSRWMHEVMHCANLDISLENMLISDLAHFDAESGTLRKCYIKFIDFGLTEWFDVATNPQFVCRKFGGKRHYNAPLVYGKSGSFMANEADIWSLGVCLFMMMIGAPPYNKPIGSDVTFQYVRYGQIAKLLQEWGRIKYVTSNVHDLLTRMLCVEEQRRITMAEIVRHPWIRHYFPADNVKHNHSAPATTPTNNQSMPRRIAIPQSPRQNNNDHHDQPTTPSVLTASSPPSAPLSAHSASTAFADIDAKGPPKEINIMRPQMAAPSASGSVMTPSPSSSSRRHTQSQRASIESTAGPSSFCYPVHPQVAPRYSSPYSPYSAVSPYGAHTQPPPSAANGGPSPMAPIMQSRTSKHDHAVYYASIDGHDRRDSRHKHKVQRAKSENALSILNANDRQKHNAKDGRNDLEATTPPKKGKAPTSKSKKANKMLFGKITLPLFGGGR